MSGDYVESFKMIVEIQDNGIIRNLDGWIIGHTEVETIGCTSTIQSSQIMQADIQANGPVPDDPKEAYMRGIEVALMML